MAVIISRRSSYCPNFATAPHEGSRSLARRVRGYVSSNKHLSHVTAKENPAAGTNMRSSERKALATLGRRGGKKAAERWKDPESEYAKKAREMLAEANTEREVAARADRLGIASWFLSTCAQTRAWPTVAEAEKELKVSRSTVLRAIKTAGISLPRGRRKQSP